MTRLNFDIEVDDFDDEWTTERLAEETFLDFARAEAKISNDEGESIIVSKYYRQAKEKMFYIPVTEPPIPIIVNISDLSPKVREELESLCTKGDMETFSYVLRAAVGKIFENVNFEYYHGSVMKNLIVRVEQ